MNYFRPLRRKFGLVILLLECLFTAGWVRSFYYSDDMQFIVQAINFSIECGSDAEHFSLGFNVGKFDPALGYFALWSFPARVKEESEPERSSEEEYQPVDEEESPYVDDEDDRPITYFGVIQVVQTGGGSGDGNKTVRYSGLSVVVPYYVIVIPLVLLSAYLLLSQSRSKRITSSGDLKASFPNASDGAAAMNDTH